MVEENISLSYRLRKIDEIRNYFIEETKQNDLMNKNHNKVCMSLNCIEKSFILVSAITEYVSISAFALLIDIPIGIFSSAVGLKICKINAGINNDKSIIKKKRKKSMIKYY